MANRRARCQDKGSVVSSLGVTIDRFPQQGDSSLTGDATSGAFRAHPSPDAQAHLDHPSRFGVYTSVRPLTDGRFGPVFLATGPDGDTVVVRTFTIPLSDLQCGRLVTALTELCGRPLEHPSIARPISSGFEDGRPYLVHAFLRGNSLAELTSRGPLALPSAIARLTLIAGALDFAEAAGVLHGALSPDDVTFSASNAGVSGFGLVQALQSAGVPGFHAQREDDVRALIGLARTMLGDRVSPAVDAVLSGPLPPSALVFAASLQDTLPRDVPGAVGVEAAAPGVTYRSEPAPFAEPLGRLEFDQGTAVPGFESESAVPAIEDLFPREAIPPPSIELDLRPDGSAQVADAHQAEAPDIAEPMIDTRPMFGTDAPVTFGSAEPVLFGATEPAMFGATEMAPVPRWPRGRLLRWAIVGVLALGLGGFAGFAGGLFVGRDVSGVTTDTVVPPPPPAPAPEGTGGQNFTDAAVDGPAAPASSSAPTLPAPSPSAVPPAESAVSPPAAPSAPAGRIATAPEASARQKAAKAPARSSRTQVTPERASGPAAMVVDSRPVGAQVFVDGRSVGYTPIVVSDLSPGTHSIRMQIPGYRPWVTAVTLGPGARQRVAASLEQ